MNRQGGFTDIFIFMIFTLVIVLFSAIFIYISNQTTDTLREKIPDMNLKGDGNNNASVVLENTLGHAVGSFNALYWIAVFLIFGMIIAIFIGSYMVTTKPIFFIPYLFIVIISVVIAAGLSNAYETLSLNTTLQSTFAKFIGANFIMAKLPIVVLIVGVVGGIIMFVRIGKKEEQIYYGY